MRLGGERITHSSTSAGRLHEFFSGEKGAPLGAANTDLGILRPIPKSAFLAR